MKRFFAALFIAALIGAFAIQVAVASPGYSIEIRVLETITPADDPETFAASGTAVSSGLICASGDVTDIDGEVLSENSNTRIVRAVKEFDCGGGDTFVVELIIRLNLTTLRTSASWSVIGGTGDYTELDGHGGLFGVPAVPGESINDYYRGVLK